MEVLIQNSILTKMKGWANEGLKDRQTGRHADKQTGRQAGRQTGRLAGRQIGRQADGQTNRLNDF
jgi:hypothetical protein